ncbi:MAG TPA: hypothetical protein ENI29_22500 [bacterium]|nr:hypothetical protein [bacterium]
MLYFFNKMGENIGGQHYDLTSKFLKDLEKSTVLKTQFPKKIPKKIEDFTLMFQKEFLKLFYHINSKLGINHKYPYTILAKKDLPVKHTKTLGAKRVNNKITMPAGLRSEGLLEFFVSLEWFYTYISSIIEITHRDNDKLLLYDLAILLCGVYEYKNLEKLSSLKENFKLISISDDFSRESIVGFLREYLNLLRSLKKYRVLLSHVELGFLLNQSYELFGSKNILKEEIEFGAFFFKLFSQASKVKNQEKALIDKDLFLSMLFDLSISNEQNNPLNTTIKIITDFLKNPLIYTHVLKIDNLVSDILTDYIILHLDFNLKTKIQGDVIDLSLCIRNKSSYVLEDFAYKLSWRPKNRLSVIDKKEITKSRDLHEYRKTNYRTKKEKPGNLTFFCTVLYNNPILKNTLMRKKVFLIKMQL